MTSLRRRPVSWVLIALGVLAVVAGVAMVIVVRSVPAYRTTFLVDASATDHADFDAVRNSVATAAQNAGDRDALALRRYGGECGDSGSTRSLVGSGTGNREQVGKAARALNPQGKATLGSGLSAAIDDFSGAYPFRGSKRNRIIVVTGHGTDACASDPVALGRSLKSRAEAAGVDLDLRFVGYKVPTAGRQMFGRIAAAAGHRPPDFAEDSTQLRATLTKYTVPTSTDPEPITLPTPRTVTTRPCTLKHDERGWNRTSRPSRFQLPEQVTLPAEAAVYEVPHHPAGSGVSRFIGEAGKALCSAGTPAQRGEEHHISAGTYKRFPQGSDFNNPDQMSSVLLVVEDPDASCYLFSAEDKDPAYVARNCRTVTAAISLAKREDIPTGNPRYQSVLAHEIYMGNHQRSPGTIELALAVRRPGAYSPVIVCIQPKSRADVCAAALTFHFIEAMKDSLPKEILDRSSQQIERFVAKYS